jgi:hypothetical protein
MTEVASLAHHRFRGYNCFASSLGTVLAAGGYARLPLALSGGVDFFLTAGTGRYLGRVGVWPGTEHPRIVQCLRAVHGVEVATSERSSWRDMVAARARAPVCGEMAVVAVNSKRWPLTPPASRDVALVHYVIAWAPSETQLAVYDSFVGRSLVLDPQQLDDLCVFADFTGLEVAYRAALLGDLAPGAPAPGAARGGAADQVAASLRAATADYGPVDGAKRGAAAIREVAALVAELHPDAEAQTLLDLAHELRFVQYQRAGVVGYVDVLAQDLGASPALRGLRALAVGLAERWFRIALGLRHVARRRDGELTGRLAASLRTAAQQEEQLLCGLCALRDELERGDVTC